MQEYIKLYKEDAFAKNIAICRNFIFKLRYTDITAMTGINQSTMSTYDSTPSVSPFLTSAVKIADMYCTTLGDLCSYPIDFDIRETVKMMRMFITRVRHVDVSEYKEQIHAKIDAAKIIYEYDVYTMIADIFSEVIDKMCRDRAYYVVNQNPKDGANFTNNFNGLMIHTGITTRKVAKACSLAKGTMTRLKQGYEPSLSTAIRLADYFGLGIGQLLMDELIFNTTYMIDDRMTIEKIAQKESISNEPIVIYENYFRQVMKLRTNRIEDKDRAKLLADGELGFISI